MLEIHHYVVTKNENPLACVAVKVSTFDSVSFDFLYEKVTEALRMQALTTLVNSHAERCYWNALKSLEDGSAKFTLRK